MKGSLIVAIALLALVGSAVAVYAVESETFTGTAARSGTYKRPLLDVDGKRYELKASDKADYSVAELLAKFSQGDTGRYVVKGTRGTVNGNDGIIIDSIAPADRPLPGTAAAAPGTAGAEPDWLRDALSGTGAQPPPTPSADDAPDWLADAMGDAGEAQPPTAAPAPALSGDEPDWLKDVIDQSGETQPPQPSPAAAPAGDAPDWLQDALAQETPAQPPPSTGQGPKIDPPEHFATAAWLGGCSDRMR